MIFNYRNKKPIIKFVKSTNYKCISNVFAVGPVGQEIIVRCESPFNNDFDSVMYSQSNTLTIVKNNNHEYSVTPTEAGYFYLYMDFTSKTGRENNRSNMINLVVTE